MNEEEEIKQPQKSKEEEENQEKQEVKPLDEQKSEEHTSEKQVSKNEEQDIKLKLLEKEIERLNAINKVYAETFAKLGIKEKNDEEIAKKEKNEVIEMIMNL